MNRRRLLTTLPCAAVPLAGCNVTDSEESTRIATDGEVRQQPSDDGPPVVGFALTNEADDPITVSANNLDPFVYFPRLTGASGSLVLIPGNDSNVYADVASDRTAGCWWFVDADGEETYVMTNDVVDQVTLEPGQTHRVNHQVYYEPEESECFPDGDYTAEHTVEFPERDESVPFTVQVTIADGRVSSVEVGR